MKKNLLFAMAATTMLFATSCQNDFEFENLGENSVVSFNVTTPDMATRAYSDGTTATHLQYAVYDANGVILPNLTKTDATINGSTTVELQLATGNTYSVVFWAAAPNAPYRVDLANKSMTVDYTTAKSNDEARDAFYKYYTFTVNGTQTETIELRRPFAQLNIGTADYTASTSAGYTPTQSAVTVKNAYSTLNLANGEVGGETAVTYATAPIKKDETFPVTGYEYLAMNYVLVGAEKGVVDVEFTYTDGSNAKTRTVGSVPVQRNYRTNIYGNILTSDVDVNVEIKPGFGDEDNNVEAPVIVSVANTEEFQRALDAAVPGTIIKLNKGVNYDVVYLRPVAGNANTITDCDYLVYRNEMLRKVENLTIVGAQDATVKAIEVVAGHIEGSTGYVADIKNLVVESVMFADSHVNPPHSYSAPIFFDLTYTNVDGLTVKNCVLNGNNDKLNFVYFYGSGNPSNSTFETAAKNITLDGNTVDGIARLCELRQTENVTITNNTIKNTKLHGMLLTIDGGTYSGNVTITGNQAEGLNNRFVRMAGAGDAVVVIKNNTILNHKGEDVDYIKVTDGNNVTIEDNIFGTGVANSTELEAAIANNATIILAEGTYVLPNKAQGKNLTFIGSGNAVNTIIATNTSGSYEGCNYALDGSTVVFKNISITTDNKTYTGYARCKATFEKCIINNSLTLYDDCSFVDCTLNVSGDQYNIWTWGAPTATFNKCIFNSDGKAMLLYGQANTKLTIENCVFNDNGGLADLKAAIEIGNDYNTSYELIVNNTKVNGYEINDKGINTGTTLWANKNSMPQDKLNVVVDGVDVY